MLVPNHALLSEVQGYQLTVVTANRGIEYILRYKNLWDVRPQHLQALHSTFLILTARKIPPIPTPPPLPTLYYTPTYLNRIGDLPQRPYLPSV